MYSRNTIPIWSVEFFSSARSRRTGRNIFEHHGVFSQYSQYSQLDLTTNHELDAIFSNITDIAELTVTLIGSLEDTLEMAEDGQVGRTLILIYVFVLFRILFRSISCLFLCPLWLHCCCHRWQPSGLALKSLQRRRSLTSMTSKIIHCDVYD